MSPLFDIKTYHLHERAVIRRAYKHKYMRLMISEESGINYFKKKKNHIVFFNTNATLIIVEAHPLQHNYFLDNKQDLVWCVCG